VTSDRQRRASQANAKASTGPKTKAGKTRSARNAFRHGLNIPISSDPALVPQAEAIARKIVGPNANGDPLERARRIGEAQVDLNRVRALRLSLLTKLALEPDYQPSWVCKQFFRFLTMSDRHVVTPSEEKAAQKIIDLQLVGDEKLATILNDQASELWKLDRYERRALSRRKLAIRDYDLVRCIGRRTASVVVALDAALAKVGEA